MVEFGATWGIKIFQGLIHEMNLIVPESLQNLESLSIFIYYALNYNSFYAELTFAFVPQKDSCYAFYLFFLHLNFDIFLGPFITFNVFFFRMILISFTCFFLELFFVFLIIAVCYFYV